MIELSNNHYKTENTIKIPLPLISSDTTRNRPSHQPTRSRSQSSKTSERIPPSTFTQEVKSPQKIMLSPLTTPLNNKSFNRFIEFPLPPLAESLNLICSSTDSSSSNDSLECVSSIPSAFVYRSPKHQHENIRTNRKLGNENYFIPFYSPNNVPPRTQCKKLSPKKMSYEQNFHKLSSHTNNHKHYSELDKNRVIRSGLLGGNICDQENGRAI